EQFITIKGIKALGNQVSIDKIKQVNILESLPYIEEEEEEEEEEEIILGEGPNTEVDDDGQQTLLF
ncbi:hypothetical protein, partial [Myroides odoratimimus]